MIRVVRVPARRLLTVREGHDAWRTPDVLEAGVVWEGPDGFALGGTVDGSIGGALVRLCPPPGAPDELVARVEALCERAGAARVKVVQRSDTPEVVRRIDVDPSPTARSHRETVLTVAAEARSADPAALRALLEGILDEEGV